MSFVRFDPSADHGADTVHSFGDDIKAFVGAELIKDSNIELSLHKLSLSSHLPLQKTLLDAYAGPNVKAMVPLNCGPIRRAYGLN